MNDQPPPLPPPAPAAAPKKPYRAWLRVPLSMVGLMIALSPVPVLLYCGRDLPNLWNKAALGIVAGILMVTMIGSYLSLRALIRKRWVAVLASLGLALVFLAIDAAIGLFFGCLYALRNV